MAPHTITRRPQAARIPGISIIFPRLWDLDVQMKFKMCLHLKRVFGQLSSCPVLYVLSPGKTSLTWSLVQDSCVTVVAHVLDSSGLGGFALTWAAPKRVFISESFNPTPNTVRGGGIVNEGLFLNTLLYSAGLNIFLIFYFSETLNFGLPIAVNYNHQYWKIWSTSVCAVNLCSMSISIVLSKLSRSPKKQKGQNKFKHTSINMNQFITYLWFTVKR